MFTSLRRIIISGTRGFYRNFSVSISAIVIIAIALLAFVSMYLGGNLLQASIEQLEEKVDVNVHFIPAADPVKVLDIKSQLLEIDEVANVDYMSREQVLKNFKERNIDKQIILDSLEVLEDNPFGASFSIKATEISQYDTIAVFFDNIQVQDDFVGIIDSINYHQNKKAIEKINFLIDYSQTFGLVMAIILSVLSITIVYNTIRLTIYTVREEISVMRLVGASRFFARGPFVVEGILYGISGASLALVIIWPVLYYITPYLYQVFVMNMHGFFLGQFFVIVGGMYAIGIILGLVSSVLVIRKYLDI